MLHQPELYFHHQLNGDNGSCPHLKGWCRVKMRSYVKHSDHNIPEHLSISYIGDIPKIKANLDSQISALQIILSADDYHKEQVAEFPTGLWTEVTVSLHLCFLVTVFSVHH